MLEQEKIEQQKKSGSNVKVQTQRSCGFEKKEKIK